ncbi:hypothetical protein BG003_002813, partial [Podila horticola]
FRQPLRRLQLPRLLSPEQFDEIYSHLIEFSLDTLEVLGVHSESLSAEDAVLLLTTFPNLKELHLGCVNIYARDIVAQDPSSLQKLLMQSWKDLDSIETVAREWGEDCPLPFRAEGNTIDWWQHWTRAQKFMSAVRSEYQQQLLDEDETVRRRRPILMQFMYPIRT